MSQVQSTSLAHSTQLKQAKIAPVFHEIHTSHEGNITQAPPPSVAASEQRGTEIVPKVTIGNLLHDELINSVVGYNQCLRWLFCPMM
jgi:hypothetical protein